MIERRRLGWCGIRDFRGGTGAATFPYDKKGDRTAVGVWYVWKKGRDRKNDWDSPPGALATAKARRPFTIALGRSKSRPRN